MRTVEIVAIVGAAAVAAWFLFDDQIWRLRHKVLEARARKKAGQIEPAVLVHLRANDLPEEVYQKFDVSTLQDQLREAIERGRLGEFDGNEFGPEETVLYMYGPDAERLFSGVEPVLHAYPLCKAARVEIRSGPPGSGAREVVL